MKLNLIFSYLSTRYFQTFDIQKVREKNTIGV